MRVYLFDWDGTLLDNMVIWHETVGRLFQKYGKKSLTPSVSDFFRELDTYKGDYYQIYRTRGINASREEVNATFTIIFKELLAQPELQLTANARYTLRMLYGNGVTLGLITTQLEDIVMPLLERFELLPFFQYLRFHAIDKKKDIKEVLDEEGARCRECYYVGDAPSDVRHANNAGVVSVAYLGGYIPEALVMAAKPQRTIKDFRELLLFV